VKLRLPVLSALALLLAACASGPTRVAQPYSAPPQVVVMPANPSRCHTCGRVQRIDVISGDRRTDGSGAVIGGIVGGVLGNQVGKGDGRKAATIAGAVIGGTIGAHTGNDNNDYQYRDDSGVVRRCRTVVTTESGYDNRGDNRGYGSYLVTYRYAGQTYQAVTNQRPGRYLDVTVDVRPRDDNSDYRH
jgi:uncharacterized protein YcfJ